VRVVAVPPAVFAVGQRVLTPVAPSAANVLGLERALGAHDTAWDTAELAERLGLTPLRTVRDVLREKAGLAAVR
jgi:hypothetical protein